MPSTAASAPDRPALPFHPGEELVYRVSVGHFGTIGRGTMRVDGPEEVRGRATYVLRFDFRGRVGPFVVEDRARSWFDPVALGSVRYQKFERSPLASHREEVEIYLAEQRWEARSGAGGRMASATPLDELSFLYHVRTLPLRDGDDYTCSLHFDEKRNPVRVRVLQRGTRVVPAGEFRTVLVELRVKDPRRYGGEGVIRLYLTDDARRIPVRVESSMPGAGSTTLQLERGASP